uniref:Sorbin and SH3 domain containing 2a n=1 Tax=Salarias fasciatus TaxID=181472 RepID=A0A672IE02_SALFA
MLLNTLYTIQNVKSQNLFSVRRATVDRPKDWYKTMFKQIHKVHKADDYSLSSNATTMAHPAPRTHTYRPLSKSPSDNGGHLGPREPSPSPVPPPPPPMPSLLQLRARDSDREKNEWGPPDRKVDTRKYRAEPKSIFEYEPGKSSILEHERPVSIFKNLISLKIMYNSFLMTAITRKQCFCSAPLSI